MLCVFLYMQLMSADRGAEMALWQQKLLKLETFQPQQQGERGGETWLHSIQFCQ